MRRRSKRRAKKSSTKKYATITELPNEILLMILSALDTIDLYTLAVVCKRLHYTALPIYLSKFDLKQAAESLLFTQKNLPGIRGLRLALFVNTLDRVQLSVDSLQNAGPKGKYLLSTQRLLSRMSRISSIDLSVPAHLSWTSAVHTSTMQDFLNILPGKSCQQLTISGEGIVDFFADPKAEMQILNSLQQVTFNSSFLFRPPYLRWMVESLNASPIHSLNIRYLGDTCNLLSSLHMPYLEDLSFSCQVYGKSQRIDLAAFLGRHDKLRTLALHPLGTSHCAPLETGISGLVELKGDIPILLNLLSGPKAFQLLNSVTVAPVLVSSTQLAQFFKYLAQTTVSHLSLSLNHDSTFEKWITLSSYNLRNSGARVETQLIHLTSLELVLGADASLLSKIPKWLALFPALASVSFSGYCQHSSPQQARATLVEDINAIPLNADLKNLGD